MQLHIIAPIALLLVLAAVFLRRRKCLLNVFAVLAAAALALTGFAVFRDLRVVPIRALAGETQELTAAALRDAEVYDTDQRVLLSAETTDGRRFRLRCYLPETEPPLQMCIRDSLEGGVAIKCGLDGLVQTQILALPAEVAHLLAVLAGTLALLVHQAVELLAACLLYTSRCV